MQNRSLWRHLKKEAGEEQVQLDVYLTHRITCARNLRQFAEECNFELKVKVAELAVRNDQDLQHLMTSRHCIVEAFKKQHDIYLAKDLKLPLPEDWELTQDMRDRDQKTQLKLRKIDVDVDTVTEQIGNMEI